ncbi:hypothetical protein [Pseudomonas sp. Marseille-QA0892]
MPADVIVAGQPFALVVEPRAAPAVVVAAGNQGPAGPRGVPGPSGGSAVQRQAGNTLSALRFVYELNGAVRYLDYSDSENMDFALGLTLTSAAEGQQIDIQLSGSVDEPSWSWMPGPVWLGTEGFLTQSPPHEGFLLYVGSAVSPTRLILNIDQPIELAQE